MTLRQMAAVLCSIGLLASQSDVVMADAISDAEAQVVRDSVLISQWMTDQLKIAIPFNSTVGNVVPKQLKIFGVEVGVNAAVSGTKLDVDSFNNLGTSLVDTTQIKMYNRLPLPAIIAHAKVGLPFGLDAGVRVGGIPKKTFDDGTSHYGVKNTIFGLDVRKVIIEEGATKPFGLTVGANFTRAKGSLDLSSNVTTKSFTSGANTATLQNGTVASRSDWDTKSVGVQAILNKQILIFNPYIGASANKNFGNVTTTVSETGTVTVNGTPNPLGATTLSGSGSATPNEWDIRALLGCEITILPFVKLGINGEYAGSRKLAGDIGLRVQFR